MPDSVVVDASVAAKLYFREELSSAAEAALRGAGELIAPQLFYLEMASLAAKRVRRGTSPFAPAEHAVRSALGLLGEATPLAEVSHRAFGLAAEHGFSAYDGAYLALAEIRGLKLLTADAKLVRRARESGLAELVWLLGE